MTLMKETELGIITISNTIFSQIIFDGMMQPECADVIWPATKRGRLIGIVARFTDTEFSMNLDVGHDRDGRVILEFNVIVQFGISIKKTTRKLADYIADNIEMLSGRKPLRITINIAGVKTRNNKARRNTKVVYEYDAD
jgi:uncharacterized alkaline shock family protein YloU